MQMHPARTGKVMVIVAPAAITTNTCCFIVKQHADFVSVSCNVIFSFHILCDWSIPIVFERKHIDDVMIGNSLVPNYVEK